jgi:hypothetical protein
MRISCTTLESFRLWRSPDQDWMPESELIATIRGEFIPTPAVLLGQAFGKVLEHPERYQLHGGYRCGGYTFSDATMAEPLKLIDRRGVFEAKAVKAYGPVDVVSKADHLRGAQLSEFKTTCSTFNFEKYAESCQWRFMVDAFEPSFVTYHVFCLDDHGNGVAELKDIHTFNFFPYAELHQDCCDLLRDFVDYVTRRGLDGVLRERQAVAVA